MEAEAAAEAVAFTEDTLRPFLVLDNDEGAISMDDAAWTQNSNPRKLASHGLTTSHYLVSDSLLDYSYKSPPRHLSTRLQHYTPPLASSTLTSARRPCQAATLAVKAGSRTAHPLPSRCVALTPIVVHPR